MASKVHNPERSAWKGRSYKKGGERFRDLAAVDRTDEARQPTGKPWTIEVQEPDGTWTKLATMNDRAWRYASEANAARDIASKLTRRFLAGAIARPTLIEA
jgi:hypothetical protein